MAISFRKWSGTYAAYSLCRGDETALNEDSNMQDNTHPSDIWSGALIAAGLVILQGFFSLNSIDTPTSISVIAFAFAIPILSCNLLTNFARRRSGKKPAHQTGEILLYSGGVLAALIGTGAAFWHTSWISALVFVISSFIAFIVFLKVPKSI